MLKHTEDLLKSQILLLNGYNDTAHFSVKEYRRCDYFRKVKEVWTAMRKRSKIGVKTQGVFFTLRKEVPLYDRPPSIILRVKKRDK